MTLVFALAAPEAVLVLIASELLARDPDRTGTTDLSSRGLASLPGLWALGGRGEEEVGESLAGGSTHPVVVRPDPRAEDLDRCHFAPSGPTLNRTPDPMHRIRSGRYAALIGQSIALCNQCCNDRCDQCIGDRARRRCGVPSRTMEVAERIKANGATLTAAERRVAGAILAAPQAVGFGTVADLARSASVGAASVVRLAAKLGFDGYSDLQESIRRDLTHQLRPAAERIREGLGEGRADHLLAELSNIRASIESVDERSLADAAVRIADEGRSVVVVSGDATGGVAAQFVGQLQQLRSGVALVAGSEVAVRRDIALLDSSAVAVVIDLRRYERWVLETHEELRSRAIWTVGITDSLLSPIAMNADVSFVVSAGSVGPFDSHVGTLSVLNLLVGSVASQLRATAADRLAAIEAAWSATGGPGRAPALIEPDGSHPR